MNDDGGAFSSGNDGYEDPYSSGTSTTDPYPSSPEATYAEATVAPYIPTNPGGSPLDEIDAAQVDEEKNVNSGNTTLIIIVVVILVLAFTVGPFVHWMRRKNRQAKLDAEAKNDGGVAPAIDPSHAVGVELGLPVVAIHHQPASSAATPGAPRPAIDPDDF